jgi:hypothetical protein
VLTRSKKKESQNNLGIGKYAPSVQRVLFQEIMFSVNNNL